MPWRSSLLDEWDVAGWVGSDLKRWTWHGMAWCGMVQFRSIKTKFMNLDGYSKSTAQKCKSTKAKLMY